MEHLVHRYDALHWYSSRRAVCIALAAALATAIGVMGTARATYAQFAPAPSTREVPARHTVNLFAQWEGGQPIDGVFAELPAGWQLEEAAVLRRGTQRLPLKVRRDEDAYFLGLDETIRGAATFVLRLKAGPPARSVRWSLVPFTYRAEQDLRRLERYRTERYVEATPPAEVEDNRVLSFQEGAPPLLLHREQLPPLSTRAPFTVETWLKTTGLGEVVLSTWDGQEDHPYPLELVVDAAGRLRYYRGRPGHHESMATPTPVADGTWHHVAVVHEPDAGRTRLLLDGAPVDSLRGAVPLEPPHDIAALGGRIPQARGEDTPAAAPVDAGGFTGQLDEVHFWPQAHPARTVRRTMRRPQPAAANAEAEEQTAAAPQEPVLLHFEDEGPARDLLAREPRGVERVRSGLRFYAPITSLRAQAQSNHHVSLWWTAPTDRGTFVVERSTDGENFQTVGQREARASRQHYSFTDTEGTEEVVFYRIRQQFSGGTERLSGTLKVGQGTSEKEGVTLMGNFPNPFSEETTIAYRVHEETHVRLAVWDLTGQRVTTLVDESQGPGYKEVAFRPGRLSSGTYFVRLRARGDTYTRKITLLQ